MRTRIANGNGENRETVLAEEKRRPWAMSENRLADWESLGKSEEKHYLYYFHLGGLVMPLRFTD